LPFDLCGAAVDIRRSCAFERCKPWFNSDIEVDIQWQFTAQPPIGIPTSFGTRLWEDLNFDAKPLAGQVGVSRFPSRLSDGASGVVQQDPGMTCTDPDLLVSGFDVNVDVPVPIQPSD